VGEGQYNKAIENFIAVPLIILISLYITASAIDPILQLNNSTFRIMFTIAGGTPTLLFFFRKQTTKHKRIEHKN
jgi:hypothetical protein